MKKYIILFSILFISMSVFAQITFDAQDALSIHQYGANTVLAADIDGDNIKDIVVASGGSGEVEQWGTVVWYKNDGKANFQTADTIADIPYCAALAVDDLNNDGSSDFVYISSGSPVELIWYSNDGSGNFTREDTIKTYTHSFQLASISIYDMDKDGDKDVLSSFYSEEIVEWFENNSIGDGAAWTEHTIASAFASDIAPVDIDADGDIDVVAAMPGDWDVAWFENNNDGTWTQNDIVYSTYDQPFTIFVSDLNNDGDLDILSGSMENIGDSARVFWFENLGNGNFGTENLVYAIKEGISPYYTFNDVISADLDLDGDEDIIAASSDNKIVSVENLGNGLFNTGRQVTTSVDNPGSIFADDLDGTSDLDLLSASRGDSKIAFYNNITPIFLQDPQDAAPVCVGTDSVLFTVKAINAVQFKWYEDYGSGFGNISTSDSHYHGVETDSLYVDAWYANMNGYKYECRIIGASPGFPRDTSGFAVITVNQNVQANAGDDRNLCEASDLQLQGNDPSPNTGSWTSNISGATFTDANLYNTTTQNFGTGTIEMYWTIDNKSCGMSIDTMIIKNFQNIISNAGADAEICDLSTYQLQGNIPLSPSFGTWRSNRGEVTFDDVNAGDAIAGNLPAGTSPSTTLTWDINNGSCGFTVDQVVISRYETIIADAGTDINICGQTIGSLSANNPSPGTGMWSSSDPNVIIESPTNYTTNLSNIAHGSNIYTWIIENHACGLNSDDVILNSYTYVSIDTQPIDLIVEEGEDANFNILVSGDVDSYQWYKDDITLSNDPQVSGSETNTLVIAQAQKSDEGVYKCVFIGSCYGNEYSSNSAGLTVNESSSGIDELQMNGINVFPNPNNGQFQITNSGNKITKLEILNLHGAIIVEETDPGSRSLNIDLSAYPKGVYILEILKNNQYIKYKLVIQ